MPGLPTGTVTFLFTDIEGSTALLQRLGDRRYAAVLAEHQRLLRDAFANGNGHEVDTQGDAFLVAFSRARDAVATAVAAQRALMTHSWPEGEFLQVRMGLHTGEPIANPDRYVGLDVHRAARIGAAAHGGQILMSDATQALVARDLPDGVRVRDLGEHRLKDLVHPYHLFQVVSAGLPVDFPRIESLDAFPNNLPRQLTSFIGREKEMAEVKRLLSTAYLVTLTGSGGAGKTRLALQVAADVVEGYSDGVWLAEFAPIADPILVSKAVATAMNVPEQPGRDMTETLVDALRPKSLLLVLDNCEHVLAASRDVAAALLRKCPRVRILATSREGLGVPGETLWRVPSLSLPEDISHLPPADELVIYEAVRLFVDRAVAVAPGFTVTSENAPVVAQVCQRLDGIPLAIELAAARVKVLAVEQIASRLDDRFRLLTGGSRTVLPRHQTLGAAIDWSYQLLSETEQALFRRVSVFAGGWSLEAAEAICSGNGVNASDILDLLMQLVDKSLVIAETHGWVARYRLLETVRQYGRDRLVESNEAAAVRTRHRDWYLDLAERAEPNLRGREQAVWVRRLDEENDNLRAALGWTLTERVDVESGLRLAVTLWWFWFVRCHWTEGRNWLAAGLAPQITVSDSSRAKALVGAGFLAWRQGYLDTAKRLGNESLTLCQKLDDRRGMALSLHNLGLVARFQGDHDQAISLGSRSLDMFRTLGEKWGTALSLVLLGIARSSQGNHKQAMAHLAEALALFQGLGDQWNTARTLIELGNAAERQGDYQRAKGHWEKSLILFRDLGDWRGTGFSLVYLGTVARIQGGYERAKTLYEEALSLFRNAGDRQGVPAALSHLGMLALAQADNDRARTLLSESLVLERVEGRKPMIVAGLEQLAIIDCAQQHFVRAARLCGAAESLREIFTIMRSVPQQSSFDECLVSVRGRLGVNAFAAAWAEGRAMTLEQAIEYALQEGTPAEEALNSPSNVAPE